jgi:Uma2 family endonuclease
MATATTALITAEEYLRMTDIDGPTELVRGEIEVLNQPTPRHGKVCNKIGRVLGNFVDEHDLGHVISNDGGIITERNPDTVRGGDVWFISYQKAPRGGLDDGYLSAPPDIVVEVLSKSDRWPRVLQKVAEYLNVGVPVVCVLDSRNRTARLYFADAPEIVLSRDDELTFPNQLPGFSVRVGDLFE